MKNITRMATVFVLTVGLLNIVSDISYAQMKDHAMGDMVMADEKAETAVKGFCPVCVIHGMPMKGNDNFVTVYKGKKYKFTGLKEQKMFVNDPEMYTNGLEVKFNNLKI